MTERVKILIEEARKLTSEEQVELLERLATLVGGDDAGGTPEEIEAAWAEEIERRVAADERGEVEWISADEVFAKLRHDK